MTRRIRAIQYGVGATGKIFVRLMAERGIDLVGAIGHVNGVGEDLGEYCGVGRKLNVTIRSDADAVLEETEADVVILPIASTLHEMYDYLIQCAESGKNAITVCDEAFFPWTSSPGMTANLDHVARKNGVTICGSGYQDIFWGYLITVLSGGSHTIDSIHGLGQFTVDDYGPVVAGHYGVGLSTRAFAEEFGGSEVPGVGNCVEMICATIGWTAKTITQETLPFLFEEPVESKAVGMVIPPGTVVGKKDVVLLETVEGQTLTVEMIGRVYKPGEEDVNAWTIRGVPDISVRIDRPRTDILTCSSVINRIPDVINANPGYVTVDRLPAPVFKPHHLGHYLRSG